jgi:hypothetical protein
MYVDFDTPQSKGVGILGSQRLLAIKVKNKVKIPIITRKKPLHECPFNFALCNLTLLSVKS